MKATDYKFSLPFDPNVGIDVFKDPDPRPEIEDVDEDFKIKNCHKNNILLKDKGVLLAYTPEQLAEIKKCKRDMMYFIERYCQINTLDKGVQQFEPYQYQRNMLKLMAEERFSIHMLPRQSGKMLKLDTPVLTQKGMMTVSTVSIGDYVYAPNGNTVRVIGKTDVISDYECYEIEFSTGESIVSGIDHLWNVISHGLVTTDELLQIENPKIYRPASNLADSLIINIVSITKVSNTACQCITVDSNDQMFLVGNTLVPTHNCVVGNTNITIRNKKTGRVEDISIDEFYLRVKSFV